MFGGEPKFPSDYIPYQNDEPGIVKFRRQQLKMIEDKKKNASG